MRQTGDKGGWVRVHSEVVVAEVANTVLQFIVLFSCCCFCTSGISVLFLAKHEKMFACTWLYPADLYVHLKI